MAQKIRFIDGPRAGETFVVFDVNDTVIVASSNTPWWKRSATFESRKAKYRACRIQSTGHVMHNKADEALFTCVREF